MKQFVAIFLGLVICTGVRADIWKWIDVHGDTHFVDSTKPIFTWVDEFDKVHYSDKPGHEDAIAVQLVWHSADDVLDAAQDPDDSKQSKEFSGESAEEAEEREKAEAYYCMRATEILETVTKAPRLYDTDEEGERVFLSEDDTAQVVAEAEANKKEWCP